MNDTKDTAQRIINLTANFDRFMTTIHEILRRAADALEPNATFRQRQEARDAIRSYLARGESEAAGGSQQNAGRGAD